MSLQDRRDDVVEAQLHMGRALRDKFRKYTIVAENSVAISRTDTQLIQSEWSVYLDHVTLLQ